MKIVALLGAWLVPVAALAQDAPPPTEWKLLEPRALSSSGGATFVRQPDGSWLLAGANPELDTWTIECEVDARGITGFMLETLPDAALPANGPGRAVNGNFVLSELRVAHGLRGAAELAPAPLSNPSVDHQQQDWPIAAVLDGNPASGWAILPRSGALHAAVFETQSDLGEDGGDGGARLVFTLDFRFGGSHVIGRFRLSYSTSPRPLRSERDRRATADAQARIPAAIARGVTWLLDQQELDGSWSYHQETYHHGMTALACYTLLKCGLRKEHPAVIRAAGFMSTRMPTRTYEAGCELMARAALEDPAQLPRIQEIADWLVANQRGTFGYPDGTPDLSNTQYAALGLRAAANAGASVPLDAWVKLGDATVLHQEQVASAYDPAGFGYHARGPAAGSLTAGGVSVLQICIEQLEKEKQARAAFNAAVKRGLGWLDRHFTPGANPFGDGAWVWYWLYGIERVGGLCGIAELGGRSWYREGARHCIEQQKQAGHWDGGGGPQPSTCFALLFLARATSAMSGVAAAGENLYGADDPDAVASLRASGDTPLTLWISSFGRESRELFEWPQDGGRGPRVARVDYLLPGSPLLADARTDESAWRWRDEPPPPGWELPDFDHRKWKHGPGAFGATGARGAPVRTEWTSEQIWLRREFLLDAASLVEPELIAQFECEAPALAETPHADLVCLFDEEPHFAALLDQASPGAAIRVEEREAYNGSLWLSVTPQQVHSPAIPGWQFPITEKPRAGEYRWLRFAWRKEGGAGIMLQLARNGTWDGTVRRFFAGVNELDWAGEQVDDELPAKWTTVTIDLWKSFGGNGSFTGIAFTPMTGARGCYDSIYLARDEKDFGDIPRSRAGLEAVAKAGRPIGAPTNGAAANGAAAASGPALEIFVNGVRVFAGDGAIPGYAPVVPIAPLASALRDGRNVLAVYARRLGAGQSLDLGLVEQRLLATVAGDPGAPAGPERFAAQVSFDRNGRYPIRARLHLVPPAAGAPEIEETAPLEVVIREALDPELLSYAQDASRNLLAEAGATASATSFFDPGWLPQFAVDGFAGRGWLSADGDRRPVLTIQLARPVRANTVLLTPLQLRHAGADRRFHVRRVEVRLDQGRSGTFEVTMPDDFRKAVLELPKISVLRRVDVRVLDATGLHPVRNALGLGEVELQLRK